MFILFNCWFILVHPCAQDFKLHASLCSQLLEHYSSQYSDRRVYWAARERSANEGDMLTLICDSFDRSKLQLPMWPLNRTPKRTVYETLQRSLLALCFFILLKSLEYQFHPGHPVPVCLASDIWGASLVLTGVLCHGHGLFLFLTSREGMSAGSNWNWECDSWLQIKS